MVVSKARLIHIPSAPRYPFLQRSKIGGTPCRKELFVQAELDKLQYHVSTNWKSSLLIRPFPTSIDKALVSGTRRKRCFLPTWALKSCLASVERVRSAHNGFSYSYHRIYFNQIFKLRLHQMLFIFAGQPSCRLNLGHFYLFPVVPFSFFGTSLSSVLRFQAVFETCSTRAPASSAFTSFSAALLVPSGVFSFCFAIEFALDTPRVKNTTGCW